MPLDNILILGDGIAGLSSALAISRVLPNASITVYELRRAPSTIGGAVNLTPNALRYFDHLGVLKKARLGEIDFMGHQYGAKRVLRSDILLALLDAVGGLQAKAGRALDVVYGKKVVGLEEKEDGVEVKFDDGRSASGDLVLGCDGTHSAARMTFVEPERKPEYSGMATAYGLLKRSEVMGKIHFMDAAVNSSRTGKLLTCFCDPRRETIYVAAVMETAAQIDRQGWKAKGKDQEAVREDILKRFDGSVFPCVGEMLETTKDWFLYPVHKLPPHGKWWKGRVMLLGDAAHAMPPQGESVGLALEDVVVFSRLLAHHETKSLEEVFQAHEVLRRERIDGAYQEALFRWEGARDQGWLRNRFQDWLTPIYLWWTQKGRDEGFAFDVRELDLPF